MFFCRTYLEKFNKIMLVLILDALGAYNDEESCSDGQINFLKKYSKKLNDPILDVGANEGYYTLELKKHVLPDSRILCFEPHPLTFKKLEKNLASCGDIKLFNLAAGDKNAKLEIFDRKDLDGSSLASMYKEVIGSLHHYETISHEVDMVRLDDLCLKENVSRISLLKIDVEGGEISVLKGLSRYIAEGKIDFINFEFNEMNVISGTFFRDFWELLSPGYNFYRMIPAGLMRIREYAPVYCELFGYQNLLAILKGIDDNNDAL